MLSCCEEKAAGDYLDKESETVRERESERVKERKMRKLKGKPYNEEVSFRLRKWISEDRRKHF